MADSAVQVDTLSGVFVIGRFKGVSGGTYPKILLATDFLWDDGPVERESQVDIKGYNPEMVRVLESLEVGDRVAVAVFSNVMTYKAKKENLDRGVEIGSTQRMVTYSARALHVLDGDR